MSNGGVSHLDIEFRSSLGAFRWPYFVFSLARLSRFSLHDFAQSNSPIVSSGQLSMLPKTIVELSLSGNGFFLALSDLLQRDPAAFPTLHILDLKVPRRYDDFKGEELLWPKTLVSLTVQAPQAYVLRLASLPPNLSQLFGTFHSVSGQSFPQSLVTLHLSLDVYDVDILPLLPSSLQTLALDVGNIFSSPRRGQITALVMKMMSEDGLSSPLPPTLTTFSLPLNHYSKAILLQLPSTITHIHHWGQPIDEDDISLLPRQLQSCTSLLPSPITKSMAKHLPKSITKISSSVSAEAIPHLPMSVRSFHDIAGSSNDLLRRELKELNLDRIPCNLLTITVSITEGFPFEALPKTLTSLTMTGKPMTSSQLQLLPKTIKKLQINRGHLSGSLEDWKLLPPNLESLHIDTSPPLTPESSSFLPRTLTYFRICTLHQDYIPQDWFAGLPECLLTLDLPIRNLPGAMFWNINLPPSLTKLRVFLSTVNGDSMRKLLHSIPSSITSLVLLVPVNAAEKSGFSFTEEDIAALPTKRLRNLDLPCCAGLDDHAASQRLPASCITATFDKS